MNNLNHPTRRQFVSTAAAAAAVALDAIQCRRHPQSVPEVVNDFEFVNVVALCSVCPVVNDVPLVEGSPHRRGLSCLGGGALGYQGRVAYRLFHLCHRTQDLVIILQLVAHRVMVRGDVVHMMNHGFEHGLVPARVAGAASHQLDAGVLPLHYLGEFQPHFGVIRDVLVADLPIAVNLVSNAPVLHPVGLRMAIFLAQV